MASERCKWDHGDWDGHWEEGALVRLSRTKVTVGRVRLAKNVNTGQLAAVKIVPKSVTPMAKKKDDGKGKGEKNDGGLSYSIEREVVIMKLIEHPNVMSLYDVWENRGEL
jgi:serine/threonine-protein kinase HSL1, negative regulator of Swe1 kinase